MTTDVAEAINEIKQAFEGHAVDVTEEDQGGAYVVVHGIAVGDQYAPSESWFGFLIPFQYPAADVYPHFTDEHVVRRDGKPFGEGISDQPVDWNGIKARQLSRRSKRWNPATDTALIKLQKVIDWFRSK